MRHHSPPRGAIAHPELTIFILTCDVETASRSSRSRDRAPASPRDMLRKTAPWNLPQEKNMPNARPSFTMNRL